MARRHRAIKREVKTDPRYGNRIVARLVSHIMKNAVIGENCNIGQNVVVSPSVKLGNNVKVQNNVSIYTGVTCEDDVFGINICPFFG